MTEVPFEIDVPDALGGERVDRAVALLTGWSRNEVRALVDGGSVLVDGLPAVRSRRLEPGARLAVRARPTSPSPPVAEPVPVTVRYEDEDVLVIAKPAGIVVHPGAGHEHGTLVHGLLDRYPELAKVGEPGRPGIVHRLDRDTSGLMVVARSTEAYRALVDALAAHRVERHYLALVWGHPEARRGVVDAPVGRSPRHRTRMAVSSAGRPARTGFEVLERHDAPPTSLLRCRLETGRTHQIRVHLAAIGHPVVGDATYAGSRESLPLDRPFLHAGTLELAHPVTGEPLRVEEPLPADLAAVLAARRAHLRPDDPGPTGDR